MHSRRGFTILELVVTVTIMAVLAGIIIVAINPSRQFATSRNTQREADLEKILGALNQYAIEGNGSFPASVSSTLQMLGTATSGCALVCTPGGVVGQTSFLDNSLATFNGALNNAQWNTSSSTVNLTAAGMSALNGTYTSLAKDASANQTWRNVAWLPWSPYGKEIPNNKVNEAGYLSGNAYMNGSILLMHMNDASGNITDSTGNSYNGTVTGGVTYNTTAKLKTGLTFNGSSGYVSVPTSAPLTLSSNGGTVMFWMKPTFALGADTGMGIIRKPDYNNNLNFPGGYNVEIYRLTSGGPQTLKATLGWGDGTSSQIQTFYGSTNLVSGTWYHVILTWNASNMYLYLNGALDGTSAYSNILTWHSATAPLFIGRNIASVSTNKQWYNGVLDEVALFNGRTLTAAEAGDFYKRGAAHLRVQVRTCDDSACSGEIFTGPAGTITDYYDDLNNTSGGTAAPSFPITNQPINRYLQYKIFFDTDGIVNPALRLITTTNNYSAATDPNMTAASCLNLTATLTPTYIAAIPFDPTVGSTTKTYYAVQKFNTSNLRLKACSPELGKTIEVMQ